MATVSEQFEAFMKTRKSKKAHVGIFVEGFEKDKTQISFMYEDRKIEIPLHLVLHPVKKELSKKDFVDADKKSIVLFIKGTVYEDFTKLSPPESTRMCETCDKRIKTTLPFHQYPNIRETIKTFYYLDY